MISRRLEQRQHMNKQREGRFLELKGECTQAISIAKRRKTRCRKEAKPKGSPPIVKCSSTAEPVLLRCRPTIKAELSTEETRLEQLGRKTRRVGCVGIAELGSA